MNPVLFFIISSFLLTFSSIGLAETPPAGDQLPAAIKVTTRPLADLIIHPREEAPAVALSLNRAQITPEISGKVVEIAVETGDLVAKGGVIARLDPWLYHAQLRQGQGVLKELEVSLDLARNEQERTETLRKKGQSTDAVLDEKVAQVARLSAQLSSQQARVEEARIRLGKTVVLAPFAGIVGQRSGQIGDWVGPGTALVELVDLDHVELSAQVAAHRLEQLEQSDGLVFLHEKRRYPVTIRKRIPIEKTATRTQEVRLSFAKTMPPPGASGRLVWIDSQNYLPSWLLVRRQESLGLFLVEEKKGVFHPLADAREGLPALLPASLVSGLAVVDGRESLADGAMVQTSAKVD
ncbi:MAG: efflux RND transporter periplasmic adaptor subunit [Magnetococcales bacterium]|nr:efflux RND transporter periplasmic adaptor subunit [Magnetococcales bacterium]